MKKALKIVFNVIAWVVLIFALLITILVFSSDKNNGTASLLGYVPLTVESDSMKPTFKKGDLIISKETDDINSLKKGDVITFWTLIEGKKEKIDSGVLLDQQNGQRRGEHQPEPLVFVAGKKPQKQRCEEAVFVDVVKAAGA